MSVCVYEDPHGNNWNNQYEDTDCFSVKMKVPGSNENRPQIMTGNTVRLRPVAYQVREHEGQEGITRQWELCGVISDYHLATETVTMQVSLAVTNFLGKKYIMRFPEMGSNFFKRILQKQFHARFSFERSGLAFAHEALGLLLRQPAPTSSAIREAWDESRESRKVRESMEGGLLSMLFPIGKFYHRNKEEIVNEEKKEEKKIEEDKEKEEELQRIKSELNEDQWKAVQAISSMPSTEIDGDETEAYIPPYCIYG